MQSEDIDKVARLQGVKSALRRPFAAGGFVVAIALVGFFAVRGNVFMTYWANPGHHDTQIRGWMTPRYVAHRFDLSDAVLYRAFGQAEMPGPRRTLTQIAASRGVAVQTLIDQINRARETYAGDGQ